MPVFRRGGHSQWRLLFEPRQVALHAFQRAPTAPGAFGFGHFRQLCGLRLRLRQLLPERRIAFVAASQRLLLRLDRLGEVFFTGLNFLMGGAALGAGECAGIIKGNARQAFAPQFGKWVLAGLFGVSRGLPHLAQYKIHRLVGQRQPGRIGTFWQFRQHWRRLALCVYLLAKTGQKIIKTGGAVGVDFIRLVLQQSLNGTRFYRQRDGGAVSGSHRGGAQCTGRRAGGLADFVIQPLAAAGIGGDQHRGVLCREYVVWPSVGQIGPIIAVAERAYNPWKYRPAWSCQALTASRFATSAAAQYETLLAGYPPPRPG